MKIASVQFKLKKIENFEDFKSHVEKLVNQARMEEALFTVFPEVFTLELATIYLPKMDLKQALRKVAEEYCESFKQFFSDLARKNRMHIVAGSTLEKDVETGKYYNTSFLFYPDGRIAKHRKLHLYPTADPELGVDGFGENLQVFQTSEAKISILICYDSIFPETSRILRLMGAEIIFVPSAAPWSESLFWDLRICCEARAIENQLIVAHSCLIGKLEGAENMEFFGKSSILYPGRGKVLADGRMGKELVVVGDVDLERLRRSRGKNARVLKDMRPEIYSWLCKNRWKYKE
ncbi:MAG: hypothetical protein B6U77_00655 [Candidatus Hecatellales archaeon ex4484_218]|nr:MAG: hypothetical protein B6U77_00655 [Candidatus Hecatellales archaeon ex4484_218]